MGEDDPDGAVFGKLEADGRVGEPLVRLVALIEGVRVRERLTLAASIDRVVGALIAARHVELFKLRPGGLATGWAIAPEVDQAASSSPVSSTATAPKGFRIPSVAERPQTSTQPIDKSAGIRAALLTFGDARSAGVRAARLLEDARDRGTQHSAPGMVLGTIECAHPPWLERLHNPPGQAEFMELMRTARTCADVLTWFRQRMHDHASRRGSIEDEGCDPMLGEWGRFCAAPWVFAAVFRSQAESLGLLGAEAAFLHQVSSWPPSFERFEPRGFPRKRAARALPDAVTPEMVAAWIDCDRGMGGKGMVGRLAEHFGVSQDTIEREASKGRAEKGRPSPEREAQPRRLPRGA